MSGAANNDGDAASFWGGARDIGVIFVAFLTWVGSVTYYYYLAALGIRAEQGGFDPTVVLVVGVRTLITASASLGSWRYVIVGLLLGAGLFLLRGFRRKGDLHKVLRALNHRLVQLGVVAAVFVALYFIGRWQGDAQARLVRANSATLSKVVFEEGKSANYPTFLSQPNGSYRVVVLLETNDAVYVLTQGTNQGQAAQIFEINREDISAITTFVQ